MQPIPVFLPGKVHGQRNLVARVISGIAEKISERARCFAISLLSFGTERRKNRAFFGRTGKDFGQNTVHDSKNSKEK